MGLVVGSGLWVWLCVMGCGVMKQPSNFQPADTAVCR